MKVEQVINLQITDIVEMDGFDVELAKHYIAFLVNEMKRQWGFDDVRVIDSKTFLHDTDESTRAACDNCVHFNLGAFEFPCNECDKLIADPPTMYVARKGENND